jgi:prevent-host-death family protein
MVEVGVRELKNSLSSYLRKVRAGEVVVVTDRGKPVARIFPAGFPEHLARLIAEGRIKWSGERFEPPEDLIELKPGPPLSEYISEDRR